MNLDICRKNLIVDEGRSNKVYLCDSIPHVGIGHRILPTEPYKMGDTITDAQVEDIFNHDMLHAEIGARHCIQSYAELPDDIQNVLVEMCFNMGAPRLRGFKKMLAAAEAKDFDKMIVELLDSEAARKLPKRYARYVDRIKKAAA